MGEILNRREQIKAAAIPPEIADASTLVTKTDYATASNAGVVKVGNNISVASGKISVPDASDEVAGVVKIGANLSVDENGALNADAGGITLDLLWTGTTSASYADISADLSAATLKSYKLLLGVETTKGGFLAVVSQNDATYYFGLTKTIDLDVASDVVKIKNEGSGSLAGVAIYGIK